MTESPLPKKPATKRQRRARLLKNGAIGGATSLFVTAWAVLAVTNGGTAASNSTTTTKAASASAVTTSSASSGSAGNYSANSAPASVTTGQS